MVLSDDTKVSNLTERLGVTQSRISTFKKENFFQENNFYIIEFIYYFIFFDFIFKSALGGFRSFISL